MRRFQLSAKSSSEKPYEALFVVEDKMLRASCDCPAGRHGRLCKHVVELLAGDESRLADPTQQSELAALLDIVATCPTVQAHAQAIADAEALIRREQSKIKDLKRDFARQLKDGMELDT